MGSWANHTRALDHIGLERSMEMLELQHAQRFLVSPTNPIDSVFAEFSRASQPVPSQPHKPLEKDKQWHLNWKLLAFLPDLSSSATCARMEWN